MIVNGIKVPDWCNYVKFRYSAEGAQVVKDLNLKSIDIIASNTSEVIDNDFELIVPDLEIPTDLEYRKLIRGVHVVLPNLILIKNTYDPYIISIVVINVDIEEIEQNAISVMKYNEDRCIILLRHDENNPDKVIELLQSNPFITAVKTSESSVGTITSLALRNKSITEDYQSMAPSIWGSTIATLDWSQGTDKLLQLISSSVVPYRFAPPTTKVDQEILKGHNVIRYDFGVIEPEGRGHLIGNKYKYFNMNKMKFNLEFHLTTTDEYLRFLYNVNAQLLIVNIANFTVLDNESTEWDVAVTWDFPNENEVGLSDPGGTESTTAQVVKLSGELHFNTINNTRLSYKVEEILTLFNEDKWILSNKNIV